MKKEFIVLASLSLVLAGCGEDIEKQAGRYLESAKVLAGLGDYSQAKQKIDSIKILYPKAFETRKAAIGVMQQIELSEAERSLAYHDSLLSVYTAQLESIKDKFVYTKDEKYMDLGLYTVPSQSLENNIGRNYLKVQVDETGRMTIVSNYSGASYIHHKSVRLQVADTYFDTPASTDVYEFKDLDVCYEKCNFTSGTDGGIAAFVVLNADAQIKVSLNGGVKTVSYEMTRQDKSAIKSLYELSEILSNIQQCRQLREESERKIRFVQENMNKE